MQSKMKAEKDKVVPDKCYALFVVEQKASGFVRYFFRFILSPLVSAYL
jgi:hypothetical protein